MNVVKQWCSICLLYVNKSNRAEDDLRLSPEKAALEANLGPLLIKYQYLAMLSDGDALGKGIHEGSNEVLLLAAMPVTVSTTIELTLRPSRRYFSWTLGPSALIPYPNLNLTSFRVFLELLVHTHLT